MKPSKWAGSITAPEFRHEKGAVGCKSGRGRDPRGYGRSSPPFLPRIRSSCSRKVLVSIDAKIRFWVGSKDDTRGDAGGRQITTATDFAFHTESLAGMPAGHRVCGAACHDPPGGEVVGRGSAVASACRSGRRRGAVLSQVCLVLALLALATMTTAWIAPAGPNGMLNMPRARQSSAACGGRLPLATSWGARSLPAMHLRRGRARTMLAGLSAQQQQRGEEEHDDDEEGWDDDGEWGQPEQVKARGTQRHAATTCIHLYAAGYAVVEALLQSCCSVSPLPTDTPANFLDKSPCGFL
jgi:hypothetical protein